MRREEFASGHFKTERSNLLGMNEGDQNQIDYLSLAKRLIPSVSEAGKVIIDIYHRGANARAKLDGSPVSDADEAAETILLPAIAAAAPSIPIVSEENAASHSLVATERFFLVDPLDGTKEFLKSDGCGAFTVNIGLIEKNVPVMGIVYAPALDRLFFSSVNVGAFEITNGKSRKIDVRSQPFNGSVAVVSASHRDSKTNQWLRARDIAQTVSIGSSLKFCLIAAGEADVYPRYGQTMEWDTAAGDAILRAAGGRMEGEDKKPFYYGKPHYRNTPFFAFGGLG